ncbi:LytR/AlgR family response regulator transcription factor [Pedobacter endophyticus]|uniref:Response regulator transcription factor n=1 Tax=Pedobacter endophyticus TaxID=2789740 RepID=A0A7S9PYF9_9SPHI|nr:LytTR family DNA-binding domain-containing protein [Pedobacter endophyticus]QPH39218.1 response regulator transcription factor [Pedobacter endophyticus]
MLTCLAIDDDSSALELLTDYIAEQPELKLSKTFTNPLIALAAIEGLKNPVDIIFLDIEMPEMNGLELAKLIRHKTKRLVFTTGYASYALSSYEVNADDYLLKPISLTKFTQSLTKLSLKESQSMPQESQEYLLVKGTEHRNQLIKLKIEDLIFVEAQEKSTKILVNQEAFMSNSRFHEVMELLAETDLFVQVHRSFLVAKDQIKVLERSHIILYNGKTIKIGRMYAHVYAKLLKRN